TPFAPPGPACAAPGKFIDPVHGRTTDVAPPPPPPGPDTGPPPPAPAPDNGGGNGGGGGGGGRGRGGPAPRGRGGARRRRGWRPGTWRRGQLTRRGAGTSPGRDRRGGVMKRYDGAVAVVTGASAGIGRRVASDLAARGATVIGLARRADLLADLEQRMKAVSPESTTQTCDVSDADGYRDVLRRIWDERGRIDVLVNNAAIEEPTPAADTPEVFETYRRLFETNFFGLVAGTLSVLPRMLERRTGIVVNVSSDAARAPEP